MQYTIRTAAEFHLESFELRTNKDDRKCARMKLGL